MITISDNDLRQLLLFVNETASMKEIQETKNLRLANRVRLSKQTFKKLCKRTDVQHVLGLDKKSSADLK